MLDHGVERVDVLLGAASPSDALPTMRIEVVGDVQILLGDRRILELLMTDPHGSPGWRMGPTYSS